MYTVNPAGDGRYMIVNNQTGAEWVWPDDDIPTEVLQNVLHEINAEIAGSAPDTTSATVPLYRDQEGRVYGPDGTPSDRGGIYGGPSGKQVWNWQFGSHSPSGWNSGGWDRRGPSFIHGMNAKQYGQSYVDSYRNMIGQSPLYGEGGPGGRWGDPRRKQLPFEQQAESLAAAPSSEPAADAPNVMSSIMQRHLDFKNRVR